MVMDVLDDDHLVYEDSDAPENDVDDGYRPNKKRCCRVPRRALKAEREKLKRDQLNDLFNKLGSLLELSEQNNGKASILNETIRLLKDMISQIQSLRKENATLLSESQYVTTENYELKDEKVALEDQIKSVKRELEEKLVQSKPDLNVTPRECWQAEMGSHFLNGRLPHAQLPPTISPIQQSSILGPVYVVPVNPDVQAASDPPVVAVRKPHPRYPTPADSWPLHLLSKQPEMTAESTAS
ncbi:hypothetical protein RND81_10G218600 [Saponaria officinalis]|uniref:BHLH domain-containing protein n=1 Tax=Saponaria officinalis TaxID=3572 RepID=A0AAW1I7B9_SAPOF